MFVRQTNHGGLHASLTVPPELLQIAAEIDAT
jgi:hypothetical protein